MKLRNKIALVTGGGSGIGRAIARAFHDEGAEVWVNDIDAEAAAATLGAERALPADVASSEQVRAMFSSIPTLDVLVNNAGIAEPPERWAALNRKAEARRQERPVETHWDVTVTLSDASWSSMLATHLNGTFYCTREALTLMGPRGSGVILNLSSTAALSGLADAPHYAAAKAGVIGFTKSVAREVASRGIRVNAVAPGFTKTPMTERISETNRKASLAAIPMGRWAEPEEIAAAAVFLASDAASYITGECLSPNGGTI